MKATVSSFAAIGLLLLPGCVPSLNPVYNQHQLVVDQNLLGTWVQADPGNRWEFSKRDESSYQLRFTDKEGQQGLFVARLAEIDGIRLLDLFPEESDHDATGFYRFHLVPIHTIYLVKGSNSNLQLAAIDYKWLDNFLTEHPEAIQNATFGGRKMITAPTADVQQFVLEHAEMFTNDFELQRENVQAK